MKLRFPPTSALLRLGAAGLLVVWAGCSKPAEPPPEQATPAPTPAAATPTPSAKEPQVSAPKATPEPVAAATPAPAPIVSRRPDFAHEVKPLFETYCYKCHGNGKKKGALAMDGLTENGLALDLTASLAPSAQDQKSWQHVLENVRTSEMPPDEEKQPTLEEREKIMKWIDLVVFTVDPDHPDPGRVTIRRLNRVEYNNTIRDLVGVDFQPADDFPADDSGYGFDDIGDVLTLPPVLFERYLAAAEKVMSLAILNDHKPRPAKIYVDLLTIEGGPKTGTTAISRKIDETESTVKLDLPVAGQYDLKLVVESQKVGAEATRMEWKFDGQILRTTELSGRRDFKEQVKTVLRVDKPGEHTLMMHVLNPAAPGETAKSPNPKDKNKGDDKDGKRTFVVRQILLLSPPQPVKAPESQYFIFKPGAGQPNLEYAARAIIQSFGKRAFRRPLGANEVERFMWIYKQAGIKGGNFEQSVQTALTALLVSPHFLFRGELQQQPDNPQSATLISEWALASRLSYFLWSTMPDEALFAEAEHGTLRKNLHAQVKRMLADPKPRRWWKTSAASGCRSATSSWCSPMRRPSPDWDQALATAMERETESLFEYIMHEDRSVLDFIGADYTFVNERLAKHYGVPGVEGEAFVKVPAAGEPPWRHPRAGQLSHHHLESHAHLAGEARQICAGESPRHTAAPRRRPRCPISMTRPRTELHGSLRQRMEQHRTDPVCASCHARMDPIGFGLEQFDGVGMRREQDEGAGIDATGQLVSGEKFLGPSELQKILLTKKRPDFLRCISEKTLTYALGRGLEFYDRIAIEKISGSLDKNPSFSNLILEVVDSVPFLMRRGEGDHRKFSEVKKTAALPAGAPVTAALPAGATATTLTHDPEAAGTDESTPVPPVFRGARGWPPFRGFFAGYGLAGGRWPGWAPFL
ncbi:MAG: DUF1592 domain-containing protein [Chthoniobacter sp.]